MSRRLTDKPDIRKLGYQLEIDDDTMEDCFNKNRTDHPAAAHDILREWRKTQQEDDSAYINLCQALTQVKLKRIASQILDYKC